MRVLRLVVLMMSTSAAVAGCRTTGPLRPAESADRGPIERAGVRTVDLSNGLPEGKGVSLASHEEAATAPDPAADPAGSELTLADLEEIALEHNPALAGAAARVDAAAGDYLQAGLYPNPAAGYHATEIGNLGTAGQQGGFISQRFITGGKLRLDRAMAARQIEAAQFLFHADELRVLSDVRVRFYDALAAQRRVQLTTELAEIGEKLAGSSKRLLEGRQISENDLLQAEIEAEQAQILRDNAVNENEESRRRLAAVAGIPTMPAAPLAGELEAGVPAYDWEQCYALVLSCHPELEAAHARVERARIAVTRAERENVPDVDLWVSIRHHHVTHSDVANVQAGIPLPILDRNQGNIARAEAELVRAMSEVRRIEADLQDRLAVAFRRYANARQQFERYRERIVPRAKSSLDLVTKGYGEGQVDFLTLLNSQRTFVRVNLASLDAVEELRSSIAVIEGQLLTGSLEGGR